MRVLPILILALIIIQLLWPTRVWMMLLVSLGGIWLIDFWWTRMLARGLRLQRELRYEWAHVGDQLEERFTLAMGAPAPALWVEIVDHSTLPEAQPILATGVDANSENSWRVMHACTRRGIFALGPTTVRTGTPFGLYAMEFEYPTRTTLMVMPAIVPLPEIQVAPGGRAREGRRRTSSFERTVSASGVREFQVGDPLKLIHWRAVAHHDELMVRTLDSTPAGDWWIWLDLDANAQRGAGANSTIEHAVMLAASLAERGLREGRAVGLVANARELVWLAPQAGETQRLEIMRALASVESAPRSLQELLASTRDVLPRAVSVIVITAAVRGAWMDVMLDWMMRGIIPTVLLLDPAAYGDATSIEPLMSLLAEWNIPRYAISADLFASATAKAAGQWEWRVNATGRAIARRAPHDQNWRTLT